MQSLFPPSAQHGNSYCHVNVEFEPTGFFVWSRLSSVCNIPRSVLGNGMDGSQITVATAAGEQKKADAAAHIVEKSTLRWRMWIN